MTDLAKKVLEDAEGDVLSALYALEDGKYLASSGVSQEEAEEAHHCLKELKEQQKQKRGGI